MNIIDTIMVEDAIRDAELDGAIKKIRAQINKAYDRTISTGDGNSLDEPPEYLELGEEGIAGLVV